MGNIWESNACCERETHETICTESLECRVQCARGVNHTKKYAWSHTQEVAFYHTVPYAKRTRVLVELKREKDEGGCGRKAKCCFVRMCSHVCAWLCVSIYSSSLLTRSGSYGELRVFRNISCHGKERSLLQCEFSPWAPQPQHNHSQDVILDCAHNQGNGHAYM